MFPDDPLDAFLHEARQRVASGEAVSVKIRALVQKAGAERRGSRVIDKIQTGLDRQGLTIEGAFASDWIDNRVTLRLVETPGTAEPESRLVVSTLESANRAVASVDRNDSLERARAIMLSQNYSQLAVLSGGPRNIVGAISWESMALTGLSRPDFSLRDAVRPADTVKPTDDLVAHVPKIVEEGFVFVVAKEGTLAGIITTADLSARFLTLAEPFFILGEIERRLRRVVSAVFTREEIAASRDPGDSSREVTGASDLTLGELRRLLEAPDRWQKLSWPVDRAVFGEALTDVNVIRNEVMHFNPDPLSGEQLNVLRNFVRSLGVLDPRP